MRSRKRLFSTVAAKAILITKSLTRISKLRAQPTSLHASKTHRTRAFKERKGEKIQYEAMHESKKAEICFPLFVTFSQPMTEL